MMDPSQLFGDPAQNPAMQAQAPQPPQGIPPQQGAEQENEPPHVEALDVEANIAEAIEAGCDLCLATESSEDFMRFAQGVSFLAAAVKSLQPPPNPAVPTAIQADQRHAAATLQSATQIHLADMQHQARAQQAQQQAQQAQQLAQQQQSRPGEPQPSTRG